MHTNIPFEALQQLLQAVIQEVKGISRSQHDAKDQQQLFSIEEQLETNI